MSGRYRLFGASSISTAWSFPVIGGHHWSVGVISGHWVSLPFTMGLFLTVTGSFYLERRQHGFFIQKLNSVCLKYETLWKITIIDGFKRKSIIFESDKLGFPGKKWPPVTGSDRAEVNVTAQSLSHAVKRSKTTAFCKFGRAVRIALTPSGRKRPLQKMFSFCPFTKNFKNGNFNRIGLGPVFYTSLIAIHASRVSNNAHFIYFLIL